MKQFTLFTVISAISLLCVSCLKNQDPDPTPYTAISGIYILNNGSWGANNSNIASFDYYKGTVSANLFESANDRKLGDLGQDLLVYGNKMYIAVSGSGIIFVTDLKGKILGEVKAGEKGNLQPRYLTALGGNVYASYYEGYVGKIDTVNFGLTLSDYVGPNPEGIATANKKLYVSISNGLNYPDFDSTVVMMDPLSLNVNKRLTVGLNPGKLVSCDGKVYCLCNGNWGDVPSKMGIIFAEDEYDDAVSISKYVTNPKFISSDNYRYLFIVFDLNGTERILSYDCYANLVYEENFIKDGTLFNHSVSSIDVDPVNYNVFVGTSDYVNNGDMYIFNQYGNLAKQFDTGGINPICVGFSTITGIL